MRYIKLILIFVFLPIFEARASVDLEKFTDIQSLIDSLRMVYVPDQRDNVYEISVSVWNSRPVLRGVTSVVEAKNDLLRQAMRLQPTVIDSIRTLPDENLGSNIYAIANVSVADLRVGAGYATEMATQKLLGMPMLILQSRSSWYRVKTIEGYVAWVQRGTVTRTSGEELRKWEDAPKVIFTDDYGFAYEQPNENGQRASDLVFGCLLKMEGESGLFYHVSYPDGRKAYVLKSQSKTFDAWKASISLTEESIVREALRLKGIPYTWGGTSTKSLDCSGYTKTIFLRHGIVIRRDASQQAQTGIQIDIKNGYDNLRVGDLLYFGRVNESTGRERIRHVGIYLGNKEFIHAAGSVHISSFDPSKPHYDRVNTEEFIRASRIIGAVNTEGIKEYTGKLGF
jgi:cell wall-associated NlpC family hydrolase